jgi:hypothetical protein
MPARQKTIPEPIPSGKVILVGLISGAVVDLKHRGLFSILHGSLRTCLFVLLNIFSFRFILSDTESLLPRPSKDHITIFDLSMAMIYPFAENIIT